MLILNALAWFLDGDGCWLGVDFSEGRKAGGGQVEGLVVVPVEKVGLVALQLLEFEILLDFEGPS